MDTLLQETCRKNGFSLLFPLWTIAPAEYAYKGAAAEVPYSGPFPEKSVSGTARPVHEERLCRTHGKRAFFLPQGLPFFAEKPALVRGKKELRATQKAATHFCQKGNFP